MAPPDTDYHLFLSYARGDPETQRWVPKFTARLEEMFRTTTGQALRIFIDVRDIQTATFWEQRIQHALDRSRLLLAVLTPSYFTSEWCGREWDAFVQFEATRSQAAGFPPDIGLILGVRLLDWSHTLDVSQQAMQRMEEARARQLCSFEALRLDNREFEARVKQLTGEIAATLQQMVPVHNALTAGPGARVTAAAEPDARYSARIGTNREQFVARLSQAVNVTVVGITNQNLIQFLDEALKRKQAALAPGAFWDSMRVVFLGESLLHAVQDELSDEFADKAEADRERARNAGRAKAEISRFLLRSNHPRQWNLYEYNALLPFVGAMFEMADGQKVVQVATIRPGYSMSEYLFMEFSGAAGEVAYYQAAFEELVRLSTRQDEVILVGYPRGASGGDGFVCTRAQFRRSVLPRRDPVDTNEWVAAIIILLWRDGRGRPQPLLQVRTEENSTRELDLLSNLTGYVNQQDCRAVSTDDRGEFMLPHSGILRAVDRELREELVTDHPEWSDAELLMELPFYSQDLQNLYFFVCQVRLDLPLARADSRAYLRHWSLPQITSVREYQVLARTCELLESASSDNAGVLLASEVLADNLCLHRRSDLARSLSTAVTSKTGRDTLVAEIRRLVAAQEHRYDLGRNQRPIRGLAGLQYREFFSTLVPAYAALGVEGAVEYQHWLESDPHAAYSLSRLREHYRSPDSLRAAVLDV